MHESTSTVIKFPGESEDPLMAVLRDGARKMLAQAVEMEVEDYLARHADLRGADGKRLVVRNGHMPERTIQTGLGDIAVKAPRVNDKRRDAEGNRIRFHSALLPAYLRRTKAIEELIPWLYLKGVSTCDFSEALASLLGKDAPGLSASTVTRLKSVWQEEYEQWRKSSLGNRRFVYIWADGIYFNIRLGEDQRMCMLVIIGADADGNKEVLAVEAGYRESAISWKEVLLRLRDRGLHIAPELAIADGALGFWLHSMKSGQTPEASGAGYIRQQTCSIRCQNPGSLRRRACFMRYTKPKQRSKQRRRLTALSRYSKPSTHALPNVWQRIAH